MSDLRSDPEDHKSSFKQDGGKGESKQNGSKGPSKQNGGKVASKQNGGKAQPKEGSKQQQKVEERKDQEVKQEESISKEPSLKAIQKELLDNFNSIVEEFVVHLRDEYGMPDSALDRVRRMCEYNCNGGKMYRGTLVFATTQILCQEKGLDMAARRRKAIVLGWCIEILQALFLVADDIMDSSSLRRGKPC